MKRSIFIVFLMLVLASFISPADEDCPKANVITTMSSSNDSFKAVQPLDFSKIVSVTEDMICGKFHLKVNPGSSVKGEIAGEFNVKLEKSRW
jgi:hypothetical protein